MPTLQQHRPREASPTVPCPRAQVVLAALAALALPRAAATISAHVMSGVRPSCIGFGDLAAGLAQLSTLHDFADEMLVASNRGSPGYNPCPPNAREAFGNVFDNPSDAKLYTNCPANADGLPCYIACSGSISLAQSGVYAPTTSCTAASFDVYIAAVPTLLANATANSLALPPFWFDELPPTRYLQAVRYSASDCGPASAARIEMFPIWDKCTQMAGKNVFIQSQVGNGSLTHRACTDAACSVGCVSQNVVSAAGSATSACVAAKDNVMTSVGVNTFVKLSGIFDAVKPTPPASPSTTASPAPRRGSTGSDKWGGSNSSWSSSRGSNSNSSATNSPIFIIVPIIAIIGAMVFITIGVRISRHFSRRRLAMQGRVSTRGRDIPMFTTTSAPTSPKPQTPASPTPAYKAPAYKAPAQTPAAPTAAGSSAGASSTAASTATASSGPQMVPVPSVFAPPAPYVPPEPASDSGADAVAGSNEYFAAGAGRYRRGHRI
ncbi:hypothetical protein HK105_205140 [Polyrhizophydium stewartii]|uniref:Uncharacterized protein n=1 Tax=Polyrhizophydium stewartii TaxID=2732419 RepID=A0ABR4N747_9FUNG